MPIRINHLFSKDGMNQSLREVGVVGLGYIGLTPTTASTEVGLDLLGIERRPGISRAQGMRRTADRYVTAAGQVPENELL